jgi:hypothetical protein
VLFQVIPDASAVALQRRPKLVAAAAFDRIDLPALAILDDEIEEPEEVLILAPEPAERETPSRTREVSRRSPPRAHDRLPRPDRAQRAKAACAAGNKSAARTVYRGLPLGDPRRRAIRRACRQSGIFIL